MSRSRSGATIFSVVVMSLLVMLVGQASAGTSQADGAECTGCVNLTIAYAGATPNLFDIGLFYARDRRIFAKHKLNVKFIMVNSDIIAYQALLSGDVDIIYGSNILLYQSVLQGAEVKGFLETSPHNDYMLIGNNKVGTLTDMPGHILGTSGPGGLAEVIPFLALEKAGVATSKITTVNAGGTSGRISALTAGRIDAGIAHASDALAFFARSPGKYHIISNLAKTLPQFQVTLFVAKTSVLSSKRPTLVRFARAVLEAQHRMVNDRQSAINHYRKYNPAIDAYAAKLAYNLLKKAGCYALDGGMIPADTTWTVNALVKYKLMSEPVAYRQVFDTRIRDAAVKFFPKP